MDESLSLLVTILDTSSLTISKTAVKIASPGRFAAEWIYWGEPKIQLIYSTILPGANIGKGSLVVEAVEINNVVKIREVKESSE